MRLGFEPVVQLARNAFLLHFDGRDRGQDRGRDGARGGHRVEELQARMQRMCCLGGYQPSCVNTSLGAEQWSLTSRSRQTVL